MGLKATATAVAFPKRTAYPLWRGNQPSEPRAIYCPDARHCGAPFKDPREDEHHPRKGRRVFAGFHTSGEYAWEDDS